MKRADDDSPQHLLEQMGRLVVPVVSPEREAALQARSAAAVDRLVERATEKRHLQRGRIAGAAAAVAAVAAVVVAVLGGSWLSARNRLSPSEDSHLVAVSGAVELSKGSGLPLGAAKAGLVFAPGDVLTTAPGAHASLALANHAAVELASETRLRLANTEAVSGGPKDERLELTQGEISFQVPKLEPGNTLSVRTPDSLVTVRGTRFSVGVERLRAGGIVTRVAVSEGRVEVESHGQTLFLTRGERWSSLREPRPSEAAITPETVAPEAAKQDRVTSAREGAASDGRAPTLASPSQSARTQNVDVALPRGAGPASTLAEENGIYEGALKLAQAGASVRALAELETLLREHPRSPLIQSARVEHFRVQLKLGNFGVAAREARRYLSEYPAGFARDEARQIVLRGLGDAD